jgi:hypothetical protein
MKKLALAFAIAAILLSCHKDTGNQGNKGIVIKGTISGTQKSATLKSGNVLLLTDARKVLVFNPFRYSLSDIVNGSFSVTADMGSVTALIFLDANNKYIGNLFTGGLNMLPLGNLKDDQSTVIDLQSLTLDNTSVIPSHNPIGDEITITDAEITRLKELGGFFESLAKNLDADNDGVPDVLSNKQLTISSHFSIYGGHWGTDNTPPPPYDASRLYINYQVRISGNISMAPANGNTVALSGPDGSAYTDIKTNGFVADKCFIAFFDRETPAAAGAPWGTSFMSFKKGTYSFTLNGTQFYSLNYSNFNAMYYLVIATPTLHTDSNGMITSVSIDYKLPDNTIVNPTNYVTILQLSFTDKNNNRVELGSLYAGVPTAGTLTDFSNVVLDTPIALSTLSQLSVNYNDLLGNEYDVAWR